MSVAVTNLSELPLTQTAVVGFLFGVHAHMILSVANFLELHRAEEAKECLSLPPTFIADLPFSSKVERWLPPVLQYPTLLLCQPWDTV